MDAVSKFVADLAEITPASSGLTEQPFFNPWAQTCQLLDAVPDAPGGRRERLKAHLSSPSISAIIVGEAPGFQGCRYSGIAFCSERLLLEGAIPGIPMLTSRLTSRPLPFSEPSATIVWGTLRTLGLCGKVVLWNAFPLHPNKMGEVLSNRTPSRSELKFGATVLSRMILDVLPKGTRLIAVGAKAAQTLRELGFEIPDDHAVRHPSMGGANAFRAGMERLFEPQTLRASRSEQEPWVN